MTLMVRTKVKVIPKVSKHQCKEVKRITTKYRKNRRKSQYLQGFAEYDNRL